MQQKLHALLKRVPARHVILGAVLAASLGCVLIGSVSAAAAAPSQETHWTLSVNGVAVTAGESAEALQSLADTLTATYVTADTVSVSYADNLTISPVAGPLTPEVTPADPLEALTQAASVRTVSEVRETVEIPFETVTVEDDTLYLDETVTEEGHAGSQEVFSLVTSVNGQTVLTKQVQTIVTTPAQDTVIRVGTQARPEYIWPTSGSYTGSYGIDTINGANRRHTGIDIAAGAGTDIVAAKEGTVVYAGWDNGGYGNLVVIEHDNGTQTYYAHNSSILVSVGDTVAQGEHIAEMGSTGRSSGSHCHFEVRLGSYTGLYVSATTNPLNYLDLSDL